jgi:hypothetical protein
MAAAVVVVAVTAHNLEQPDQAVAVEVPRGLPFQHPQMELPELQTPVAVAVEWVEVTMLPDTQVAQES